MKKRIFGFLAVLALCGTLLSASSPIGHVRTARLSAGGEVYQPTIEASAKATLLAGNAYEFAAFYEKLKSEAYYDGTDQFAPVPAVISWTAEEGAQYYTVKLSQNADLSDAMHFVTFDNELAIENLFMGTDYYYQIVAHYADKVIQSRTFAMQTAYLPRTISIEGISNTRDIGGYYTVDGTHRLRQGLVYRGGETEHVTEQGRYDFLYTYGIRTDLDLRGYAKSPFGDAVNFVSVSAPYYMGSSTGILAESYRDALITEIKTFADPASYPIYVHCALGRDRTGTVCFLISALCGVGETDLYRDFEMSFLSERGSYGSTPSAHVNGAFTDLFEYINTYPVANNADASLADRTAAFMMEQLDITQEEIDSIRSIMLEEVAK